jgi:hypothetical protein
MQKKMKYWFLLIPLAVILFSCRDTVEFTESGSAKLRITIDTLHFDTVFSTVGSTTQQFKIFNPNDKAVKTNVSLGWGKASYFRLNVDGQPSNSVKDLEIMGNDSAYVFVEVNVDPQNSNAPVIIKDSVLFATNGNVQYVKLLAYGQDVYKLNGERVKTQTWNNDKPYLIYNSIQVDSSETLTIPEGTQIYMHNDASFLVYGTLIVSGTKENPVVFQGDRLEDWYKDTPGQWGYYYKKLGYQLGGIHFFSSSQENSINYAIIKDGIKGVQLDSLGAVGKFKLKIGNSVIQNMSLAGIYAQTSTLLVYNTIISNCGYYAAALAYGGNYQFYHSTIANYYPQEYGGRKAASVLLNNYYIYKEKAYTFDSYVNFGNCIIAGDYENELVVDEYKNGDEEYPINYLFDHCYINVEDKSIVGDTNFFKNILTKKDTLLFVDKELMDFHLDSLSVARNQGAKAYMDLIPFDLDENPRNIDKAPDLGAYERIDQE